MHNVINHSPDNRNLASYLDELNRKVRILTDKMCCLLGAKADGDTPPTASTSAGSDTSVPAGFSRVTITLLSGTSSVTMSDGSIYPLTIANETLTFSTAPNEVLPAIPIDGGTWKWVGTN